MIGGGVILIIVYLAVCLSKNLPNSFLLELNKTADALYNSNNGNINVSKIHILTRITPAIYDYDAYSYFLFYHYAIAQSYTLVPLFPDDDSPDYIYHRKLAPILHQLVHEQPDYVVWIDAGNAINFTLLFTRFSRHYYYI